jgi:integrase
VEPVKPARSTAASLPCDAGHQPAPAVRRGQAKAISEFMGHSSIQITYDTYGHLMPGNEAEAAGLQDAYLARFR